MFPSTTAENFQSWERFLDAYYEPIRVALGLLPFVGAAQAEELAQSFFVKMYHRDLLGQRPATTGRFRDWLYVAARRHAIDEWRKTRRRHEQSGQLELHEPADPRAEGPEGSLVDADELYALSVLHLVVERVRKQLIAEGKPEHWMIFDELVLAPLIPGRVPKTREELLAMFPGQSPVFLDNRVTTVKRIFRRILPTLVPADPTDRLTPEQRFQELLEILGGSRRSRLWLAFLTDPRPGPGDSSWSSLDLVAWSSAEREPVADISQDVLDDELRVLLGFWLDMPVQDYLENLDTVCPTLTAAIRESLPLGRRGRHDAPAAITLSSLILGADQEMPGIAREEQIALLKGIKTFAKGVYRTVKHGRRAGAGRRESSMPVEIAQVLYSLAGALALVRHGVRILGVKDDQFRQNVLWALDQPWLDARLRPVFIAAIGQFDRSRGPR